MCSLYSRYLSCIARFGSRARGRAVVSDGSGVLLYARRTRCPPAFSAPLKVDCQRGIGTSEYSEACHLHSESIARSLWLYFIAVCPDRGSLRVGVLKSMPRSRSPMASDWSDTRLPSMSIATCIPRNLLTTPRSLMERLLSYMKKRLIAAVSVWWPAGRLRTHPRRPTGLHRPFTRGTCIKYTG